MGAGTDPGVTAALGRSRPAFDDGAALLEANGSRLELGRALFNRALMRQARGDDDAAHTKAD